MAWERSETQETKFNMAFATMQRINECLVLYARYSYTRDAINMYYALKNLFIELEIYVDAMKDSKIPYFKETLYSKRTEVEKYLRSYQNMEIIFSESKMIRDGEAQKHLKNVLIDNLEDYNILLRKIISFKKLGMPEIKFSAEDAFEEGYDE
jgi:hypothetical protein